MHSVAASERNPCDVSRPSSGNAYSIAKETSLLVREKGVFERLRPLESYD
jgi:hypothetical protein